MRKTTLILCSILLGFSISAAQEEWESAVDEIREELQKSMEEIEALKERLHEDGLPSIRGLDSLSPNVRASLGVFLDERNDQQLVITGFTRQSNARDSGLQENDVLIAIDAQDLTGDSATATTVIEYLETIEPGDEVILSVERGDEEMQFTIETQPHRMFDWIERRFGGRDDRPGFSFRNNDRDRAEVWIERLPSIEWDRSRSNNGDVQVTDLNPDLGSYFGVESGVLVLRAGEESSLEAGDVIVAVGDQSVATSDELHEQLRNGIGSVTVHRDGKTIELSIDETLDGLRLEREVRIFSRRSDRPSDRRLW